MITFIVVACVVCIALFMLNKKGILGFVLLFGFLGAVGSDYTIFTAITILLTITAAGLFNMAYPIEKWYNKKVNKLMSHRSNSITMILSNILAFVFCTFPFLCVGAMLGEGIFIGTKSQAEILLNPSVKNCDIIVSAIFIITFLNILLVKCIEFIDWVRFRNHHST